MRILLVEPENNAAAYLRKGLMESGFAVDIARHATDALDLAGQTNYDFLVCDGAIRPPGFPPLRGAARQTPVLFLGLRDKPSFAFSDLLTGVRSMLHWGPGGVDEILKIDDLQIDLVRHRATRGG